MKIKIEKLRSFTNDYDNNASCVVRVFNKNLKPLGGRHAWVKLSTDSHSIYRMAKAGRSSPGFSKNSIELDYDSLLELNATTSNGEVDEDGFYPCDLTISSTNKLEFIKAYWNHPDHGYRISLQISMISMFLGIVSILGMFI